MAHLSSTSPRDLQILERLESEPETTQADLAEELGVAVGTINFAVKRLIKKGYLRVTQLQRRRLRYILTPAGLALRARLAVDSLNYSLRLYRETRRQAKALLTAARQAGATTIAIRGQGDLAEIISLTCLEMGLPVKPEKEAGAVIAVVGTRVELEKRQA